MLHTITPLEPARQRRALCANLRDAQLEHDIIRRALRSGATADLLSSDHQRWEAIGAGIAALACLIEDQCIASAFCDSRPDVASLTVRLSEAVDDLVDEPAWAVIDAAARLAAHERRGQDL